MRWASSLGFACLLSGGLPAAEDPYAASQKRPLYDCALAGMTTTCRFDTPAEPDRRFLRLVTPCEGEFVLNGTRLLRDGDGFGLSPHLAGRRQNLLSKPATCGDLDLVETPRVFAYLEKRSQSDGKLLILLVNTLENTANFELKVIDRNGATLASHSGTIAAGTKRQVELAAGPTAYQAILWKGEEAVEGAYRYIVTLDDAESMENRTRKP
jgi:hypothetical protein